MAAASTQNTPVSITFDEDTLRTSSFVYSPSFSHLVKSPYLVILSAPSYLSPSYLPFPNHILPSQTPRFN